MPKISIIIRSKNEEKWIRHCLTMLHAQQEQDFEVILVDNHSQDATRQIAERSGAVKIISIDHYLPGAALNRGIEVSSGEFIVCLSAHCIPQDESWLGILISGFEDQNIAGVYGRQVPLSSSSDADKRDLLITFGLDRRVQVKDYFFHNANSAIRRSVWEQYPFDEQATNIEDRLWAKQVTEKGLKILYEPDAVVYHHHGIHQNLNPTRLKNTVSVLEGIEPMLNGLPPSMQPEQVPVTAICPVLQNFDSQKMNRLIADLNNTGFVDSVFIISETPDVKQYCEKKGLAFIPRPASLMPDKATLEDVLQFSLREIEAAGTFPELVLYVNYAFEVRPDNLFKELLQDIQYKDMDTVFPAVKEYYNLWRKNEQGEFAMIGDWLPHERREPTYRAINGLGTVTRSAFIRRGRLIGERVGLLVIKEFIDKKNLKKTIKKEV